MPWTPKLRPWARDAAAAVIHRTRDWVDAMGAIGPNDARGRRFRSMGPRTCIAYPPGSIYGERWIAIGEATLVCPHVTLAVGMPDERMDPDAPAVIHLGDRCSIGRGSSIVGRCRIDIGDDVTTGPNVYITDHNHTYADPSVPIGRQWLDADPVRIGSGTWIAAGAVILPGADIGRNVTVAAGSVVRGHVPDHAVVAGSPARIVRRYVDGEGWVPPMRREIVTPDEWLPVLREAAGLVP